MPVVFMTIMVAVISVISLRRPASSAKHSPSVTMSWRPGLMTRPTATKRSPLPGDIRFILNSVVSTPDPFGIIDMAAKPQAVSTMAVSAAA